MSSETIMVVGLSGCSQGYLQTQLCFDMSVANVFVGGNADGGKDEKIFNYLVFYNRL
jgi:hypothetical protein